MVKKQSDKVHGISSSEKDQIYITKILNHIFLSLWDKF